MCHAILEDLNSSKFISNYFKHSNAFCCQAWCFLVLAMPSLAVLPLLLYLIVCGDITEEALGALSSSLVIVPIIAVSISFCVFWKRNVINVCANNFSDSF